MVYSRPWRTYSEQLELLKSRGLGVTDDISALKYLERIGYYRLSAYWYPFRIFESNQQTDQFHDNSQLIDAVKIYLFDKKLRLLVMDAIERIEISLRVDISYLLGQRDIFAYKNINEFHPTFAKRLQSGKTAHEAWLEKYLQLQARSKEEFVKHYKTVHGGDLPIWVATELCDFGTLSHLFSMMKVPDQTKISAKYAITDFKIFSSWLRSLNYLRNLSAHHSRLWNRNIIDQPKLPKIGEIYWCDGFIGKPDLISKPFLLLAITLHLVKIVSPNTTWGLRLKEHLNSFPNIHSSKQLSLESMGISPNWQDWWS